MSETSFRTIEIEGPGRNLLNPSVMRGLEGQLRAADADADVAGIVLTGKGEVFCGGLDVAALQAGGDPLEFAAALVSLLKLLPTLGTPVAAVVNGDAVASGSSLVAASDFVVAVPEARIGTFEVSIGIWPMIAQVPLIQRIGPRLAMENIGAGEPFTSARAREVGLVNVIAPSADAHTIATAWLTSASRARTVYAVGRRSVYELAELDYESALENALAKFTAMFRGEL